MTKEPIGSLAEKTNDRRGFVARSVGILAALASAPNRRSSLHTVGRIAQRDEYPHVSSFCPLKPTYLPPGYRLITTYLGRPDGFGGAEEAALWYKTAKYGDGGSYPLAVFVTSAPIGPFALTEGRDGESIAFEECEISEVMYYDGMWVVDNRQPDRATPNGIGLRWDKTVVNAVVAQVSGYAVGIRGSKLHGVDRTGLLRVLRSMRAAARP